MVRQHAISVTATGRCIDAPEEPTADSHHRVMKNPATVNKVPRKPTPPNLLEAITMIGVEDVLPGWCVEAASMPRLTLRTYLNPNPTYLICLRITAGLNVILYAPGVCSAQFQTQDVCTVIVSWHASGVARYWADIAATLRQANFLRQLNYSPPGTSSEFVRSANHRTLLWQFSASLQQPADCHLTDCLTPDLLPTDACHSSSWRTVTNT